MTDESFLDLTDTTVETLSFGFTSTAGDNVYVAKEFEEGRQLNQVADLFKRFLMASGFDYVTDVVVVTDAGNEFSASEAH